MAVGTRWFHYLCERRGRDSFATFKQLVAHYLPAPPKGPFQHEARSAAGFTSAELDWLEAAW